VKKNGSLLIEGGLFAAAAFFADNELAHAQVAPPQQQDVIAALQAEMAAMRAELEAMKAEAKKAPAAPATGGATASTDPAAAKPAAPAAKKWFDNINVRGYAQMRYNRLLETNRNLKNEQGDRSMGDNGGIFMRRVRLIFSGQINKKVYFYIQPDFASSASSTGLNFGQLRDAYFDIGVDKDNEFRFRVGQSKVPYGFENLQSSQNRLPLDRSDGINSAFSNERDIGVFAYWAPKKIRERYAMLVNEGLKGSGDYGVIGIGAFNGQTANKPELNNRQHLVARASYPFEVGKQIIETSLQAYRGKFVIPSDQLTAGVGTDPNRSYKDQRVGASFILYPRPFGIQAEYNQGKGPRYNPVTNRIEEQDLDGGYVTFSYMTKVKKHTLIPFARFHYYDGGKKHELDARSYNVKESEIGVEWQPTKNFELTAQYTLASRRFEDSVKRDNLQRGRLLRLQAQVNF
jgi:hypothetical protein